MTAREELLQACDEFESTRLELDAALAEVSYDHEERHAIGALGADITNAARHALAPALDEVIRAQSIAVASMHDNASMFTDARTALANAGLGSPSADTSARLAQQLEAIHAAHEAATAPNARLLVAFKTLYFTIRAEQDALYRTCLFLLERQERVSIRASMEKAANAPANPVHRHLGDFADEYFAWFAGWRALRNRIKHGRSEALAGAFGGTAADDYGMSIVTIGQDGGIVIDCSRATRISDVTKALRMTTGLTRAVTQAAQGREHPPS